MSKQLAKYVSRGWVGHRGFGYTRVSTDDQENNTSHEQQEIDIREEAEQRGIFIVEVFHENFTGAVWRERKVLQEMRRRYLSGEEGVDCVLFRTYDRLSREPAHYYILKEEMRYNNIETICIKESNDTSVIGQLIQMMLLAFAKLEREKIFGRTQAGKLARVTNKKLYNAGNKPPYGYNFSSEKENGKLIKGKLIINEKEAKIVRKIFALRADRQGYASIAKHLNREGVPTPTGKDLWSDRVVHIIIERGQHLYSGAAYGYRNKEVRSYEGGELKITHSIRPEEEWIALPEGTVPAIVDAELIRQVQEVAPAIIQDAARNAKDPEMGLLKNGFARCSVCGNTLTVQTRTKPGRQETIYYSCCGRGRPYVACTGMNITVASLDSMIWAKLEEILADIKIIEEATEALLGLDMFSEAITASYRSIEQIESLIITYKNDLQEEGLSPAGRRVVLNEIGRNEELREELQQECRLLEVGKARQDEVREEYIEFTSWCKNFSKETGERTYKKKRDVLRFLGVQVRVFHKEERDERYEMTLSPSSLLTTLAHVPTIGRTVSPSCLPNNTIGRTVSLSYSPNTPFLLRVVNGRILFYTPGIDRLTPTV